MKNEILRRCSLFSDLTDNDIEYALDFYDATTATYKKGEYLNKIGNRISRFGLVLEGSVQVSNDDYYGHHMILQNVTKGHTFGESLCFLGKEAEIYIEAMKDSEILWLKTERVKTASSEQERMLANRFVSMIAKRALMKNNHVQILSKITLRSKLITFFSQYATKYGDEFTVPFDRNDMAVYIGTERSALSRELSKMKKDGIIEYEKNHFRLMKKIY